MRIALGVGRIGVAGAVVAISSLLSVAGTAGAASGGACSVPAGARSVATVGGVRVWSQSTPEPAAMRRQYGRATYPRYSGCAAGYPPQVLFNDYAGDPVAVRVAGDYVGLLDRGGTESLYLANVLTGATTNTTSFTDSVQDNGGSEANEPGPLDTWRVASSGWLVYLDTLTDLEGSGTALVAFGEAGATTLDLAPLSATGTPEIGGLVVRGGTVTWRSSLSGTHRVRLTRALLPGGLPAAVPNACELVPPSLARELLGPLSATPPPSAPVPPTGFWPRVRTGSDRSSCAYAAAADSSETLGVAEQRVMPATVSRQQRAIDNTPRADNALVLPGIAAMLFDSRAVFHPSSPDDLRLFIHGVEVDLTTSSSRVAGELEFAGLVIERELHEAPPAASHI